jgi:hypothetical protein
VVAGGVCDRPPVPLVRSVDDRNGRVGEHRLAALVRDEDRGARKDEVMPFADRVARAPAGIAPAAVKVADPPERALVERADDRHGAYLAV